MLNTQLACEYERQHDSKSNTGKMEIRINDTENTIEMCFNIIHNNDIHWFLASYTNEKPKGDYIVNVSYNGFDNKNTKLYETECFMESNKVREINVHNLYCCAQYLIKKIQNKDNLG